MIRVEGDRRVHPRVDVQQPCKIYDERCGKYLAGSTRNLSTNGLLIEVPHLTGFKPGDALLVGVAMKRRQGLLQAKEMMEATVVRTMETVDDRALIAVTFDASAIGQQPQQRREAA